uniref:Uncharacterized protein n=1 Tax=Candidatus Kentrum sp. LFY TaxID=2126342 RepID=A0A450WD46_9GAMM|nr:MAG: hypothetical protein BECKLFY1418C_GA0070996_101214 [Candidatus Kentron sp. LFY]
MFPELSDSMRGWQTRKRPALPAATTELVAPARDGRLTTVRDDTLKTPFRLSVPAPLPVKERRETPGMYMTIYQRTPK